MVSEIWALVSVMILDTSPVRWLWVVIHCGSSPKEETMRYRTVLASSSDWGSARYP